eukprot:Hpha_TRINITY_DN35413_c0_g1::TRINITY_DN35413_c0_g1_i1::g.83401::m.83401
MLTVLLLACAAGGESVVELLSNVVSAEGHVYGLRDSEGYQLGCIHVDAIEDAGVRERLGGDTYLGLYHSPVGSQLDLRLASSKDLLNWTYRRTLVPNADMPFLARVQGSTWLLLTHEQWQGAGSTSPCQVSFKLYYNESDLFFGSHFNTYTAPLSVGSVSKLEGTPNIYAANLTRVGGLYAVDVDFGFHFNDRSGKDQVAQGRLVSFGPTTVAPRVVSTAKAERYDELFISQGAIGNIGQRAPGVLLSDHISVQEANVGSQPPTVWADWRVWLYSFNSHEGEVPSGQGSVRMLNVTTHGGSTSLGNPSWHVVPCPGGVKGGQGCLFVSYFIFGEGAAPGEAAVLAFYKALP